MNQPRRLVIAATASLLAARPVLAQDFPTRAIRILVGFAPGGATDIVARLLQPLLAESLGQPIVVENRSGAGGNIATDQLLRAEADGHTLMVATPGQMVVNPLLNRASTFVATRDITPIGQLTTGPLVLVVPAASPYRDAASLLDAIRARPGEMNYASAGVGSSMHVAGEMLKALGNLQVEHVPYRGSGPAVTDLVAGKVDFMIDSVSTTARLVRDGTLRALGVTGAEVYPDFPDAVPLHTLVPGMVLTTWLGVVGPAGLPDAVVARLATTLEAAVANPGFAQRLQNLGSQAFWAGPQQFAAHLVAERERAAEVVRRANIRLE